MTSTISTTYKIEVKRFFCALAISIISTSTFSQSGEPASVLPLIKNDVKLENYVWSFVRAEADKNSKSLIDFNVIDRWKQLGEYVAVSPNGKCFAYTVERGSGALDDPKELDSLIIQSTDNAWRNAFSSVEPGFFSADSKEYIFQDHGLLRFLKLDGNQPLIVNKVVSYKVPGSDNHWLAYKFSLNNCVVIRNLTTGKEKYFFGISSYTFDPSGTWLACTIDSNQTGVRELVIYKLGTDIEKRFSSVSDFLFAADGNALLLKTIHRISKESVTQLQYVTLEEGKEKNIWSSVKNGINIGAKSMDAHGKQVAFVVQDSADLSGGNSMWYFREGMDSAIKKISGETTDISPTLQIGNIVSFTDNDRYIKFSFQPKAVPGRNSNELSQLEIWNHKDAILRSAQTKLLNNRSYSAIFNIDNGTVIPLEGEEKILSLLKGDFAVLGKNTKRIYGDRFWEKGYGYNEDSSWVVSLKDGKFHLLTTKGPVGPLWFSPGGNYLVYFDPAMSCHYFSYDLNTGKLADISPNVTPGQLGFAEGYPISLTDEKPEYPFGLAAWLEKDAGVMVYDNNDIWELDLTGKKAAVNITSGLGQFNNIILSLMSSRRRQLNPVPILRQNESLLLRAFNTKNKYNGFYRKIASNLSKPELLSMGRYFMNIIPWCQDPNLSNKGLPPVKANDVNTWIVQRQSDTDAANYYQTNDFKAFKRLTDYQPQKGYRWLSEELCSFKHLNGITGQGILYKPENFDSSKKYPVLIIFYGRYSDNLYQFPNPAYNETPITPGVSPAWFLSNGYLVFTPDIYVSPLKYGPEAYNVIEGAARYLKRLPYVDANKLGCCSHSWSAKLGAYIFTHSKSFKATAISEGFLYADMFNVAFSTDEQGRSHLEDVENGFQFGNFWENKNTWLDQTTIVNVDKSNSPLLLLCNKQSSEEYQNQTLQLFTVLRRLEKKVWWLRYEKSSHTLYNLSDMKDYTIRYTQYFDHYLKEAPAPAWMTHEIRYGQEVPGNGFELDPAGSCGKDCEICKRWNRQYKLHPEMFTKLISEWHLDQ